MHRLLVVWVVTTAAPAVAAPVHGLVYDDRNGDGRPSAGEPGFANAVVALGIHQFVVTDASGRFVVDVPAAAKAIAWVRVPDGFVLAGVGAGRALAIVYG